MNNKKLKNSKTINFFSYIFFSIATLCTPTVKEINTLSNYIQIPDFYLLMKHNNINWANIILRQKLSYKTIETLIDKKLYCNKEYVFAEETILTLLILYQKFPKYLIDKYKNKMEWTAFSYNINIPDEHFKEYEYEILKARTLKE